MATAGGGKVLLIVEQDGKRTPHEERLKDRLEKKLHYEVSVQGADQPVSPTKDVGLVVVCAPRASADLRELDLPVLACNPAVLYDLGMVLAKKNVDFGNTDYSSVFICPDAVQHPLAGGLTGEQEILSKAQPQGWAKPGPRATVAATIGGDPVRAVAFAYDKGAPMPGQEAPHRRAAFLAGPANVALHERGGLLFDAAAGWALKGGGPAPGEGLAGHWFLQDGTPTRTLSAEEYRDWVHDQVGRGIWKSLLAILSFLGIGGIVGLYLFLTTQIDGKIDDRFTKNAQDIKKTLDDAFKTQDGVLKAQAENQAVVKVSQLFFQTSKVWDEILKKLDVKAEEALKANLAEQNTRERLVHTALQGLYGEGKLADELVTRLRSKAVDSPQARRLLLQLILIYGTEGQRQSLRKDLLGLIGDDGEEESVRATALESYRPAADPKEAEKDLLQVLKRLDGKPLSETLQKAYGQFVSHFPDSHAGLLLGWLAGEKGHPGDVAKVILAALFKMPSAPQADHRPLELVVELAVSRDKELRTLGAEGLRQFAANPKPNVSPEMRYAALEKLLNGLTPVQELDGTPTGAAGKNSPILAGLLRPGDEAFLARRIPPEPTASDGVTRLANDEVTQLLLFNWAGRLEKERAKEVSGTLLDPLYRVRDALYGEGTARVLEVAVRYGNADGVGRFWNALEKGLYHGKKDKEGMEFRGQKVLEAAVIRAADSSPPFTMAAGFLESLAKSTSDDKKKGELRDEVWAALRAVYFTPARGPADLAKLRAALESPAVLNSAALREAFAKFLDEASQKITAEFQRRVSYLRDLNLQADQYTQAIQSDPKGAYWYHQRGVLYLTRLRKSDEALADLKRATELDPASYEYHEALGDLYRRQATSRADAVAEYQVALVGLEKRYKGKPPGNLRPELLRKLALTYVLQDDPGQAERTAQRASELSSTKADKARAEEVLGLLALKRGDASAALDRTGKILQDFPAGTVWNWIIRYLAARQRGDAVAAKEAYEKWQGMRVPNDLGGLYDLIPDLMNRHLGVLSRDEGMLKGPPDVKSGKNEVHYPVDMKAGTKYVIDMESAALDSYLIVLDPAGKVVGFDDDGGGGLNARLPVQATRTGTYTIIATTFVRGDVRGPYTLFVRELPKE
jgi:tetratricopeptide (TPR) repeat protein